MHEAQLHDKNTFITLTYADNNLPPGNSLHHRDWQLFAKRLRKTLGHFRYYMCGEYGETFTRPHYHACLFGIDFPDKQQIRRLDSGCKLYESKILTDLWQKGFASLGSVTFESAAYVARYVTKKITGQPAHQHYTYIDRHGEIHQRKPEYGQMSRRPGLAAAWLDQYVNDIYPADRIRTRNHPHKPPRYYDLRAERLNYAPMREIRKLRKTKLDRKDNTARRLLAKETVATAKYNLNKRKIP